MRGGGGLVIKVDKAPRSRITPRKYPLTNDPPINPQAYGDKDPEVEGSRDRDPDLEDTTEGEHTLLDT